MTDDRSRLFDRVAAAKTYIGSVHSQERAEDLELAAFMAIFHPEVPPEKVREMKKRRPK